MPSIEIVCINQSTPSDFSHLPFEVDVSVELLSHRSPTPLFQSDFDRLQGCIYHLLDGGGVTAYDLLKQDWDNGTTSDSWGSNIEFREEYASLVYSLLNEWLLSSPVGQILFTSDYQFGPDGGQRHSPISLTEFWTLHDSGKVQMNDAYYIIKP